MQRINVEVSEITNQDLKEIAEIEKKLFGDAWSEKMFAEFLNDNSAKIAEVAEHLFEGDKYAL